jgi:hypothetical protein
MSIALIGAEPLTQEQREALVERCQELSAWVRKFGIGPDLIDEDEASNLADSGARSVFTVIPDWAVPSDGPIAKVGFWLELGFTPGEDDYYQGSESIEDGGALYAPYTEIRILCAACQAEQHLAGECDSCEGDGELTFDLTWTADGSVTAVR